MGSRSDAEKLLEAALSFAEGAVGGGGGGGVAFGPVSRVPWDVHFAPLALFTRRVGTEEVPPLGNPFVWEGRSQVKSEALPDFGAWGC